MTNTNYVDTNYEDVLNNLIKVYNVYSEDKDKITLEYNDVRNEVVIEFPKKNLIIKEFSSTEDKNTLFRRLLNSVFKKLIDYEQHRFE